MDEPIVTFGVVMGLEAESKQDRDGGDDGKEALLIFCRTSESAEGKIIVTQRMLDLKVIVRRLVSISARPPRANAECLQAEHWRGLPSPVDFVFHWFPGARSA
jgi:hypothetical protein